MHITNIREGTVAEIIQQLSSEKSTGVMTVLFSRELAAEIRFLEGSIVSAEFEI